MKSTLLTFTVAALLVVPGVAQMRSTNSSGPIHAGRTFNGGHGPGIGFRPGFGRHFHGNRFGTVIYPFGLYDGFYDGFYDNGYRDVPDQPASPVVVVRDAPAATAPATPVPPAEPKMIEVPEPAKVASNIARTPAAVFVLSDGRRLETQTYTITDSVLTIKELHRPAMQVPLDQLNVEATLAENHQRGLNLQLPENRSEIVIGF